MNVKSLLRSFAAGIIGPELYGRLDLTKYQTGLAKCLNFWVLPHGPAQNRPGFEYVLEAKDSSKRTRIVPFAYSTEQTFILEFGDQYVRFHTQGATLLETGLTITGVTQANPGVLTYTGTAPANGDWLYLSGIAGMTQLNGRYVKVKNVNAGANTFELSDIHGGGNIDTSSFGAYTSGGTAARVYTVATPYVEADLFDLHFVQSADVLTIVHPSYEPRELRRLGATNWQLSTISFTPSIATPPRPRLTKNGTGTTAYSYKVTALADGTLEESLASSQALNASIVVGSITKANPGVITTQAVHGLSAGNRIYLSGVQGMTQLSDNYYLVDTVPTASTLTLKTLAGAAIDTSAYSTYTSGGVIEPGIVSISQANPGVLTFSAAHNLAVGDSVYLSDVGGMTQLTDGLYTVNTAPTGTSVSLKTPDGAVVNTTSYSAFTSGGRASEISIKNNLSTAGNYNLVHITPVPGAVRYNVYKLSNGLYGYIGQTDGSAFKDDNITADVSQTPPTANTPFAGTDDYPAAVGYHEQRRCFGGTNNKPQNFWATRSATENNLSYSIPTRDDDAIAFRVSAREVNRIRHILSLDQLIFLTSGGEWKVAPQNSDILTPDSASPKQIASEGASNVQPAIAGNAVIYVQESGSRLREMKYQWETNGYNVRDISIMAPHLFDDYTIVDLAYAKTPNKMIWCVRSDGRLIGMTYLPEHDVLGFHEHDTQGTFESVACVKEGSEHVLYAVVNRTINARTVRYIERMHSRKFTAAADAFFVDSGLTYDGAPTAIITGLWHLEGADVAVLADAAEVTGITVANGAITLPNEASTVHIGLPIVADLQTLPMSFEAQAFGQGYTKNINGVDIRVQDSSGYKLGPTFDELVDTTMRSDEPYGTPPALSTGVEPWTVMPQWGQDAQLCIRQAAPLPVTVLSLTLEVAVGG